MIFSCIIVDDEPLSHRVLKSHIHTIPQLNLTGNFYNAQDARNYLSSNLTDIMFLDIQMPEITGPEFLRKLPAKPITIFTTAYREYALEGYELGVIDYLLKPVNFDRFLIAVKRAIDFLQLIKLENTAGLTQKVERNSFELLIKTGTKKVLIDYRQILYAQGLKDYTILQTEEKKYVVKGSIKAFEDYLPKDFFMRIHKSFIVAIDKIKLVQKNKIELKDISIPIGRYYKGDVDNYLKTKKL